jgi:hypothetical protein
MKLSFVKRIETSENSIFYSLMQYNDKILGFGRKYYYGNTIKKVTFNNDFDIIEDNDVSFTGEDPRCFLYKNKLYILDNTGSDGHLIDYENGNYIYINIGGKNFSFINHDDNLYFIWYIKPFILFRFDVETGNFTEIQVDDDKYDYNYEYRGGTPGYKLNDNEYYGFGHRTYITENGITIHDIFKWVVFFEKNKLPRIMIIPVEQPENSKNICDPTCVIEIENKKYLITAESELPWFSSQDYITNVYEIIESDE